MYWDLTFMLLFLSELNDTVVEAQLRTRQAGPAQAKCWQIVEGSRRIMYWDLTFMLLFLSDLNDTVVEAQLRTRQAGPAQAKCWQSDLPGHQNY